MTWAQAFDGKANQEEFTQVADFEYSGGVRSLVTRNAITQEFRFVGLNEAEAKSKATIASLTDVSGTVYTDITPAPSFTDGSYGSKVFEKESVQVSRRRFSPHIWEVIVRRTGSEYYLNGTKIINGPTWAFPTSST